MKYLLTLLETHWHTILLIKHWLRFYHESLLLKSCIWLIHILDIHHKMNNCRNKEITATLRHLPATRLQGSSEHHLLQLPTQTRATSNQSDQQCRQFSIHFTVHSSSQFSLAIRVWRETWYQSILYPLFFPHPHSQLSHHWKQSG